MREQHAAQFSPIWLNLGPIGPPQGPGRSTADWSLEQPVGCPVGWPQGPVVLAMCQGLLYGLYLGRPTDVATYM